MGRNLVVKEFTKNDSWICPAGVKRVRAIVSELNISPIDRETQGNHSVGLDTDGNAYAWGSNTSGQLGTGNTTTVSSPVAVVGGLKFRQICAPYLSSIGLSTTGDVYAWGYNPFGGLGDNTLIPKSSPVLVVGGLKFKQIAAGISNTNNGSGYALTTDGDAYAWGGNGFYTLGDGTNINRSSPVLVVGGLKFKRIAAGNKCAFGITDDGNAYSWGVNTFGELGDGTTTNRSSPVAVIGGLKFSKIVSGLSGKAVGLTVDGLAYVWGTAGGFPLGDGTSGSNSSPVAVVGSHIFVDIASSGQTSFGLKSDGSLYGWGYNSKGQVGDGTAITRSSPVLVVGGLKFVKISCGGQNALGITDTGQAYAWGENLNGSHGDGTTVDRSSPVLVVGGKGFLAQNTFNTREFVLNTTPGQSYDIAFNKNFITFGVESVEVSYGVRKLQLEYFS